MMEDTHINHLGSIEASLLKLVSLLNNPKDKNVLHKTERPNSYEYGKAGNRIKVYFDTSADLTKIMNDLKPIIEAQEKLQRKE